MAERVPVLFGEVLFDCFEDGSRVLGGAPFNVAWHLQGFGLAPLLITRVGDDPSGHGIRRTLSDWGMNTAGLQLDSAHPTGEVRVTLEDGQPDFDIVADRAWDHVDHAAFPPLAPALVYHGSLGLRSPRAADSFDRLCAGAEAPRYLDVNLRPPYWDKAQVLDLVARARWLKINDAEMAALGIPGADLQAQARHLLETYPLERVIVTRGAAGAFALDRAGEWAEVVPESGVEVVDTVGAGDAFAAVTLVGILNRWPLDLTLRRAQRFASQVVGQRGATAHDPAPYHCLRKEWGI
jgi:fructokinase